MKKRGDLARQMIQEKDNEIIEIKKLLTNNNDNRNNTSTNSSTNNYTTINLDAPNDINSKLTSYDSNVTNSNINTEQSYIYLRKAFSGFVKAKRDVELENLGRVIVALLCFDDNERQDVLQAITQMGINIYIYSFIINLLQLLIS
jgi:hypothetical protein